MTIMIMMIMMMVMKMIIVWQGKSGGIIDAILIDPKITKDEGCDDGFGDGDDDFNAMVMTRSIKLMIVVFIHLAGGSNHA